MALFYTMIIIMVIMGTTFASCGIAGVSTGGQDTKNIGIAFLIIGISCFIILAVYVYLHVKKKKKREQEIRELEEKNLKERRELEAANAAIKQAFEEYLKNSGFEITYNCGKLLVDEKNKKWCKELDEIILSYSEVEDVEIDKRERIEKTGEYSSHKNSHGSGYSRGYNGSYIKSNYGQNNRATSLSSRNGYVKTDASTYTVYINTNNELCPLVTFECGTNQMLAKNIEARILMMKKTANS